MSNYLASSSGILTNYGLEKINEILVGKNNVDFANARIFISDKQVVLDETSTINNISYSYTFPIYKVKNDVSNKYITLSAIIPPEITNFSIRSMGIICEENNIQYLFAYSSVALNKPSRKDIYYTLELTISYDLSIVNFNIDNLAFNTSEIDYATVSDYESIQKAYNTCVTSLEHAHFENALITGYNKPQKVYFDEQILNKHINCFENVIDYVNLFNIVNQQVSTNITDAFYNIKDFNYSKYLMLNLADYSAKIEDKATIKENNNNYTKSINSQYVIDYANTSYIKVNNKLMTSRNDNIGLINKTMLIKLLVDGTGVETDGVILQKVGTGETTAGDIFTLQKQSNQIIIKVYFNSGYIECTTQLTKQEFSLLTQEEHNLIITCDTTKENSNMISMYINGEKISTFCTVQGNLDNEPSGSFVLTNYDILHKKYTTNNNYIDKICCFNRILTDDEIYHIGLSLK